MLFPLFRFGGWERIARNVRDAESAGTKTGQGVFIDMQQGTQLARAQVKALALHGLLWKLEKTSSQPRVKDQTPEEAFYVSLAHTRVHPSTSTLTRIASMLPLASPSHQMILLTAHMPAILDCETGRCRKGHELSEYH